MFSKIVIFACLVATGFGFAIGPHCKVETQDIETQVCHLEPAKVCGADAYSGFTIQGIAPEPVCADVVDKHCVPALKPEEGCREVTRKVCLPSHKVVDQPTAKLAAPYAISELFCRFVPKAKCEAKVTKAPKTVCDPLEAKLYFYGK
jgi:hypothetical protein